MNAFITVIHLLKDHNGNATKCINFFTYFVAYGRKMMFKLNSLVPGVNLKVTHTFFILCLYTYFNIKGLSSQSMMIPNKVSAGLEVIAVTSIDATKISNK